MGDSKSAVEDIERMAADFCMGSNFQGDIKLRHLPTHQRQNRSVIATLRKELSSAEPVPEPVRQRLRERLGKEIKRG